MRYLLALVLVACAEFPTASDMDWSYEPPGIYRVWYAEMEACSGLKGDYDRLRIASAKSIRMDGTEYTGYWLPSHTILLRTDRLDYDRAVKHEFMHDLLQVKGHPAKYFNGVCGDLITTY